MLNWDKIDLFYDLDQPVVERRSVLFLCNQFIHSFVFVPDLDDLDCLSGVFFASDRQRHSRLLRLDLDTIIALYELVGSDYPACAFRIPDKLSGQPKYVQGPPPDSVLLRDDSGERTWDTSLWSKESISANWERLKKGT